MTKVGVADWFLHIKNPEDVAFFLSESEVHRLLTLEQNFDRTEVGYSTENQANCSKAIRGEKRRKLDGASECKKIPTCSFKTYDYVAREQSKQIVEDRAQIKQIVDFDGQRI